MSKRNKVKLLRSRLRDAVCFGKQRWLPGCTEFEQDVSSSPQGTLLLLDIADFSKVKSIHGYDAGDQLLTAIADHIHRLLPKGGKLYRLHLADFGLLLKTTGPAEAEGLARQLLADCAKPWRLRAFEPAKEIYFHANVCILPLDKVDNNTEDISCAMEYMMQQAHAHGGLGLFEPEGYRVFRQRRNVENELRNSLAEGMKHFRLVYQPIIDPATGLWCGVEALCRWQSPVMGNVSPEDFIPVAESTGMIFRIGEWAVETAIAQVKRLGLDKAPQFMLDVNVAPVQLTEKGLENCVVNALDKHDYPAAKLCLEITETSEVSLTGPMLGSIERLAGRGVRFALDDFGTGYSTISELFKLPIQTVKIDRSLVQRIESDSDLQRLFYAVSEMAHGGGMRIVAEGVESSEQADTLLLQGADYFQGYLFSMPISIEQLEAGKSSFYTSADSIPAMDYSKVDLRIWDGAQDKYVLPLSIYRTLSRCMSVLFKDNDVDHAIESVMGIVGSAMGVSRAGLFLRDKGHRTFSITHQWCAEGIDPSIGQVQNLDISAMSPQWYTSLKKRGFFLSADTAQLSEKIQAVLSIHGIRAIAQFAVMQGNRIAGFVTFDDCTRVRYWTREEIRMLHILANMLTGAISKSALRRQVLLHQTQMATILNRMDMLIYTANLETGEIYFANSKLLEASGQASLVGRTCWEVLHRTDKRCSFCPMLNLNQQSDPDAVEHLEFYSKPLKAHLKVTGSIIPWEENKVALLVSCVNINELKNQQLLLKKSAEIDPLTKAYNRAGFFSTAESMFQTQAVKGQTTALAFLDVDGLKKTNDEYGHAAGDALLCATVDSIAGLIRDTDIVARMGGDEFVVLFNNCTRKNAAIKLEKVLEVLRGYDEGQNGISHSFSYGVVDTVVYPYKPGRAYIEEMVDKADELQLEQKISKHGTARDRGFIG